MSVEPAVDEYIDSLPEERRETVRADERMSLYICAADDDGYLAESNAERLGQVSVGKSCIRFTKLENLDLDVAGELCRRAAQLVAAGRFAM